MFFTKFWLVLLACKKHTPIEIVPCISAQRPYHEACVMQFHKNDAKSVKKIGWRVAGAYFELKHFSKVCEACSELRRVAESRVTCVEVVSVGICTLVLRDLCAARYFHQNFHVFVSSTTLTSFEHIFAIVTRAAHIDQVYFGFQSVFWFKNIVGFRKTNLQKYIEIH